MKRSWMLFIVTFVLIMLLGVCTHAYEGAVIKEEFTFEGKSLGEYAGIEQVEISGKNAYVINLNTGVVVYGKNMDEITSPASTVKLLTALVVYENVPDIDEAKITISNEIALHTTGRRMGLEEGDVLTVRELLYGVMVRGANDAALALAQYVSGDEASFCELMNQKANELGAVNSNFVNVTGVDEDEASNDNTSTAKDIAIIAKAVYFNDELFKMSDTLSYTIEETNEHTRYVLTNRNTLISQSNNRADFYKGASGMSLGSTNRAGNCIVSCYTTNENLTYLCVVLGSPEIENSEKNAACTDAAKIFDYCRENFSIHTVTSTNDVVCEIDVSLASDTDHVTLFPDSDISMLLPTELDYQTDIKDERRISVKSVRAPVYKGNEFGEIVVYYKDTVIGKSKLVAGSSVDRSNLLYFFNRVEAFLCSTWFRVFAITAIVLYVLYVVLYYYAKHRRSQGRRRK